MLGGLGGPELLILFILMLVGGIAVAFLAVRRTSKGKGRDARDILDERYARGGLGEEDYQQMRRDIES